MQPKREPPSTARATGADSDRAIDRRRFLAAGAGLGATLVAGCSTGDLADGTAGDGPTAGSDELVGTFELLISDQPVAIDEFDSLDVSFDRARVFRADGDGDATSPTATPTPTSTASATETTSPSGTTTGSPTVASPVTDTESESGEDDQQGFAVLDLDGATVDLTQVVGDKAMGVFEGELAEGRYAKIELYAADVVGVVDGETVQVTIPSGKLQLIKPFEVVAGETLRFVFDINVVRKGQSGEYNLLPVISESGVAGTDVPVEDVTPGGDSNGADDGAAAEDDAGGPPDDQAGNQAENASQGGNP